MANETDGLELTRWAIQIGVPAAAALAGVTLGACLTGRREVKQRQIDFVERQLRDFYSPLLGIRNEIRMQSELRVRIQNTAGEVWRELCEASRDASIEAQQRLTDERGKEFSNIIEYDNQKLEEELIPAYANMVELFKDNLWLAEPDTVEFFAPLLEFVELWQRWLNQSIPAEVMDALKHGEESLHPFYEHLQCKHSELRQKLERGYV